jgi:hypothetical protein
MRLISEDAEPSAKALLGASSGVVFVEYVALMTLVTLIGAISTLTLGVPLLKMYRFAQMILSLPIP